MTDFDEQDKMYNGRDPDHVTTQMKIKEIEFLISLPNVNPLGIEHYYSHLLKQTK